MLVLFLIWLALMVVLTAYGQVRQPRGGALNLSYFFGLSLIHVPGVLPYLASDYVPNRQETETGFQLTIIGMAAFVVGCIVARFTAPRRRLAPPLRLDIFEGYGWRALAAGFVAYFIAMPVAHGLASLEALVSPLGALLVVGLWLQFYSAEIRRDPGRTYRTMAMLPLLPLATLSTAGFIGYGVNWVLSVIAFQFSLSRRRIWFYLAAPVVVFLGLSFFVAYMGERSGIRDLVWKENAGITERLGRIAQIVTNFKPLDLTATQQVDALEDRLNQNYLVGVGVERLQAGVVGLHYGDTFPAWNLVPRALWPDKPDIGGGGDLVSAFTGIHFDENTSVGVGQVLEFYMNFGEPGVILGFLVLGFTLTRIDARIAYALHEGNMPSLLRWAMPGLTLIAPGSNMSEIIVAAVGAIISANVLSATPAFGAGVRRRVVRPAGAAFERRPP
jgi:hypothetical protein